MRLRNVSFVFLGMIIAGSIAAPLVNSDCDRCGGDGKMECPACEGTGAGVHYFFVECACGGDPNCSLCQGISFYLQITTSACEECDGKGWIPCPACRGDGQRNLLERIPDLWRGELKY